MEILYFISIKNEQEGNKRIKKEKIVVFHTFMMHIFVSYQVIFSTLLASSKLMMSCLVFLSQMESTVNLGNESYKYSFFLERDC